MSMPKGPIITLVAGLILAAVVMVLNLSVTNRNPASATASDVVAGASPAATTKGPAATTPPPAPSTPAAAVQPPAGTRITYAGSVSAVNGGGGGATLAIAIKDGKAVAYLCDGKSAEAWLQGSASGGSLDLTGTGEARLTGTYGNGAATGTVTAVGREFAFSLKTVAPPSGLYRAAANVRNAQVVGGWIVLANGKQVGLMRLGDSLVPAPPLDTTNGTTTVDGSTVTAGAVDGSGL
jgi:hypothetical protein